MASWLTGAMMAIAVAWTVGPTLAQAGDAGQVWYVDAGSRAETTDGRSWATAFRELPLALAAAGAGDAIWVAAGVYYPTTGTDPTASFQLRSGVAVYGGFRGGETALAQRDHRANVTVLSGDIGRRGEVSDNSEHVVRGADGAVLDGFVITGGNSQRQRQRGPGGPPPRRQGSAADQPGVSLAATGTQPVQGPRPPGGRGPGGPGGPGGQSPHTTPQAVLESAGAGCGAGLLNLAAAPVVRNCTFYQNRAMKGGAVYNLAGTQPGPGRAVASGRPMPRFIDCDFIENSAELRGGGVANDLGTHPTFIGCRFLDNRCTAKGGGMYNDFGCSPVLVNCLFARNRAESAAALGNDGGSSPTLLHCTITANHAVYEGPSLYQGTGPSSNPVVQRSILWANTCDYHSAGIFTWHDNRPQVTDSVVEDSFAGTGNRAADPRLDPTGDLFLPAADGPAHDLGYRPGRPVGAIPEPRLERAGGPAPGPTSGPAGHFPAARVVHVAPVATAAPTGLTWAAAYTDLQRALDHAGAVGAEVWVAAGTYRPAAPAGGGRPRGFVTWPGVAVYGGFAGGETAREQRRPDQHVTTLSGDVGRPGDPTDNAYHVLIGADGLVLDGLVITGGHADGPQLESKGGGLLATPREGQSRPRAEQSSPRLTVTNCVFVGNRAREGGAIYSYGPAELALTDCLFQDNSAENGGALLDRVGVISRLTGCRFEGNVATWRGGAAYYDYGSRPEIRGCTFVANRSDCLGGALYTVTRASQLEHTVLTVVESRFEGNQARVAGGAVANDDLSQASFTGCEFVDNQAVQAGGAIHDSRNARSSQAQCRFAGNRP